MFFIRILFVVKTDNERTSNGQQTDKSRSWPLSVPSSCRSLQVQKYIFLLKLYGLRKRKLVHIFILIDFDGFWQMTQAAMSCLRLFLSFSLEKKGPILRKPNAEPSELELCWGKAKSAKLKVQGRHHRTQRTKRTRLVSLSNHLRHVGRGPRARLVWG